MNYKRSENNKNNRLLVALLAPMLLITLSSFGYAQWNNTLTTIANLDNAVEDLRITAYEVAYYNGYGIDISIADNKKSIDIEDTLLFPEWELKLVIELHNAGTAPLYLSSEIKHDGATIPETDLLKLFRIVYTDGFYDNAGPDGQWFFEYDEPFNLSRQLFPCDCVYKLEHLIFDAQLNQTELQGQSFTFQVIISGSAPTQGGS